MVQNARCVLKHIDIMFRHEQIIQFNLSFESLANQMV